MDRHEILRESPAYQWILEEGRKEGIEKGRKEGRQQVVQAMQQAAICIVVVHLAEIEKLARAKIAALDELARTKITALDDLECLHRLIVDLNISQSQEEMERVLHSL
jgi:predicted transposase YdaD